MVRTLAAGSALTIQRRFAIRYVLSLFEQDPAEPLFESTPAYIRLDPTDAEFVDVIHTDAKSLLVFGKALPLCFGQIHPILWAFYFFVLFGNILVGARAVRKTYECDVKCMFWKNPLKVYLCMEDRQPLKKYGFHY